MEVFDRDLAPAEFEERRYSRNLIGDEILKGQTQDTNSTFLCRKLNDLGISVQRICVVQDNIQDIAKEVFSQSTNYTYVITTGGIGPTHDDVTFEGVAKAFGTEVHPHPTLVELCHEFFGQDLPLNSPQLKMAHIPLSSKITFGDDKKSGRKIRFPLVSLNNVYVFPGIPSLLELAFPIFQDILSGLNTKRYHHMLYIKKDEMQIAPALNDAVTQFQDKVIFGSYPSLLHSYYRVRITLEGQQEEDVKNAVTYLSQKLPEGSIINYEKDSVGKAGEEVYRISQSNPAIQKALGLIHQCYSKYQESEVCLSFNGGKDCTALLHLIHAYLQRNRQPREHRLTAFYAKETEQFPQVKAFINETVKRHTDTFLPH